MQLTSPSPLRWDFPRRWVWYRMLSRRSFEVYDCLPFHNVQVVSCLGVIGTDPELLRLGNGLANTKAFSLAKKLRSVERCAYVSVASELVALKGRWPLESLSGYFEGKVPADSRKQHDHSFLPHLASWYLCTTPSIHPPSSLLIFFFKQFSISFLAFQKRKRWTSPGYGRGGGTRCCRR